jgi:alkylhydroperoxidase family enzyme
LQDNDDALTAALERCDVQSAPLTEGERVLLEFVATLTKHAYRTTDDDVDRLRSVGWTDPQIAEAVYITAMFAFFNRVADAFGLKDPGYRQLAVAGKTDGLPQKNMEAK